MFYGSNYSLLSIILYRITCNRNGTVVIFFFVFATPDYRSLNTFIVKSLYWQMFSYVVNSLRSTRNIKQLL